MSSGVGSLFGLNSVYQQLIDNLITLESTKKFQYEDQKQAQQTRKSAISTVGSNLTSLNNLTKEFTDLNANKLSALGAASSNENAFTLLTDDLLSSSGNFNFEIQQLAKSDVRVSAQFSKTGNEIAANVANATGEDELSFTLNVNSTNYTITLESLVGLTNEEALGKIAAQINSEAGNDVQATILRENSNTVRLSVRSKETGSDYAISFSNTEDEDSKVNIARFIEFTTGATAPTNTDNANIVAGGDTSGGRIYNVADLDAKFTIDGLNFTRSNNNVDDAITGLTIQLKALTTATESITIDTDTDAAIANVEALIESFNTVVSDIRANSYLNSASGDRGPLSRDRLFKELIFDFRTELIRNVADESATITDPVTDFNGIGIKSIFDIGLNFNQDGTLTIENRDALENALVNSSDQVEKIFSSNRSDSYQGIAYRLQDLINNFVKTDGLINSLTSNIDDRIDLLDQRIKAQDEYLARREVQLRNQFIQLQQISDTANSQFQSILAFSSYFQ